MLYLSSGIVRYKNTWVILEIDTDIHSYYRSLIPKYIYSNRQMYSPHISVARKEPPRNMQDWGKFEGNVIDFHYDNTIFFGEVYIWLNCYSKSLENIMESLGLSFYNPYIQPPTGFSQVFHTTIGNFK